MDEQWIAIADFPDYEVSDLGRVRRTTPHDRRGHALPPRLLKTTPAANRYPRVTLQNAVGQFYKHVHVLVCATFHGPRPSPGHEVAHLDGDRNNNAAPNLRWTTNEGNHRDRERHGRAAKKLTAEEVRSIRSYPANGPLTAKAFGVTRATVNRIRNRDTWGWLE